MFSSGHALNERLRERFVEKGDFLETRYSIRVNDSLLYLDVAFLAKSQATIFRRLDRYAEMPCDLGIRYPTVLSMNLLDLIKVFLLYYGQFQHKKKITLNDGTVKLLAPREMPKI